MFCPEPDRILCLLQLFKSIGRVLYVRPKHILTSLRGSIVQQIENTTAAFRCEDGEIPERGFIVLHIYFLVPAADVLYRLTVVEQLYLYLLKVIRWPRTVSFTVPFS